MTLEDSFPPPELLVLQRARSGQAGRCFVGLCRTLSLLLLGIAPILRYIYFNTADPHPVLCLTLGDFHHIRICTPLAAAATLAATVHAVKDVARVSMTGLEP